MFSRVTSLGLQGIDGYEVTVECYITSGLPAFDVVGLPDAAVKEARIGSGRQSRIAASSFRPAGSR